MNAPKDKDKRKPLGLGLDALLPASGTQIAPGVKGASNVYKCPIDLISPQPGQPRQHFDDAALDELAASIREHGLLEPILVRRSPADDKRFEIIAGERRWRASQRAGHNEILVIVKDATPKLSFELALIENVQRQDLNPVEFAEALDRLLREHSHTQEALAGILKKDRSTISNALRLLKLPAPVRTMIIDGRLTEGHARPLLALPDDDAVIKAAEQISRGKLTVRQAEALVREKKQEKGSEDGEDAGEKKKTPKQKTPAVRDVEERIRKRMGCRVEVRDRDNKGEIVLSYADLDELDRILAIIEGDGGPQILSIPRKYADRGTAQRLANVGRLAFCCSSIQWPCAGATAPPADQSAKMVPHAIANNTKNNSNAKTSIRLSALRLETMPQPIANV